MKGSISKILLYGLSGVSAIMGALFMMGSISEGVIIGWCYVLLILAAATAILFSIANLVTHPKKAKTTLIGVAALLVVMALSYAIAGSDVSIKMKDLGVTESTSKWSGAGLIAFYILAAMAILSAVYSGVSKMIK